MTENRTTEKIEELRRTSLAFPPNIRRKVNIALFGIEQAIAATLGSCTLTADDVLNAVYKHGARWQAIADELNATLWSEECEFMPFKDEDWGEPNAVRGVCSKCSALMYGKDNYCQNCGARVRGGAE